MSISLNAHGLPRGTGSLQIRGRTWWMIYRDPDSRIIQQNTGTSDKDEARRMLAYASLATLREITAALERIAHEDGPHRGDPTATHSRPGAHREEPQKAARAGRTDSRQGRTRDTGKRGTK